VNDENRRLEFRHIDNPESAIGFPDPDLSTPGTDACHRLPVRRVEPLLDAIKLKAGLASRRDREGAKVGKRSAAKRDGFRLIR
jgi:hypothetical protein